MKDKDAILLEKLYQVLIEGAEDRISNAFNTVKKFLFYKYKRENGVDKVPPDIFEQFDSRAKAVVDTLKGIIDDTPEVPSDRSFGKEYGYLPQLAKFFTLGAKFEDIQTEYRDYSICPNLRRQKYITKATDFEDFATKVHAEKANIASRKNTGQKRVNANEFISDESVYRDDNIVVFCAIDPNNIIKTVLNSKKYGQGKKYELCISGEGAFHWNKVYRHDREQTTYFVYFRVKQENAPANFIIIDVKENGNLLFNSILDAPNLQTGANNDIPTNEEYLERNYPELKPAFDRDIFKPIPLSQHEKDLFEKLDHMKFNAAIEELDYADFLLWISFNKIYGSSDYAIIKDKFTPEQYYNILNEIIETGNQIDDKLIEDYPTLIKKYEDKKNKEAQRLVDVFIKERENQNDTFFHIPWFLVKKVYDLIFDNHLDLAQQFCENQLKDSIYQIKLAFKMYGTKFDKLPDFLFKYLERLVYKDPGDFVEMVGYIAERGEYDKIDPELIYDICNYDNMEGNHNPEWWFYYMYILSYNLMKHKIKLPRPLMNVFLEFNKDEKKYKLEQAYDKGQNQFISFLQNWSQYVSKEIPDQFKKILRTFDKEQAQNIRFLKTIYDLDTGIENDYYDKREELRKKLDARANKTQEKTKKLRDTLDKKSHDDEPKTESFKLYFRKINI